MKPGDASKATSFRDVDHTEESLQELHTDAQNGSSAWDSFVSFCDGLEPLPDTEHLSQMIDDELESTIIDHLIEKYQYSSVPTLTCEGHLDMVAFEQKRPSLRR